MQLRNPTIVAAVAAFTLTAAASASTILFEDFEGDATPGDSLFGAGGFQGSSDGGVTFAKTIGSAAGVGGTAGYELAATIDADGLDPDGGGNTFFFGAAQVFTSLNLSSFTPSDLILTADIANSPVSDGQVALRLVDETTGQGFTFADAPAGDLTQFTSFGGSLDTASISNGGQALTDGNYSVYVQFENVFPGSGYDFSADAVNTIVFDNVSLTVIPEPASAAAIGLLGLVGLRRRR
ncbi:MAG: PEP-CTERM sorting domain-containing protein [Planctomycetota bacterium]